MSSGNDWIVKRGEDTWQNSDIGVLQSWAREGKILPGDYIYHPVFEKWLYAKDVEELMSYLASPSQAPGPAAATIQPKKKGIHPVVSLGCIGTVLLVIILGNMGALPEDTSAAPPQTSKPTTPGSNWNYRQSQDDMAEGQIYYATVTSTNTVNFAFPYSGAQHATLTLRTHPRYGRDLIFQIERGQLLCPSYDGCTVLVRFDDDDAVRYSAGGPEDGSSDTLFIRNYSGFAGKMLRAEKARISVSVFQEGSPTFEFDVSDFSVDKYRPTD